MARLTFDCSPEQMDVVADHLLLGAELGILPDEKHWILAQARKRVPNCRIASADLDIAEGKWHVTLHPVQ